MYLTICVYNMYVCALQLMCVYKYIYIYVCMFTNLSDWVLFFLIFNFLKDITNITHCKLNVHSPNWFVYV